MDQTEKKPVGLLPTTIVNLGKSSRLQAIRDKARLAEPPVQAPMPANRAGEKDGRAQYSAELILARQIIDRRLAEIRAGLPAGKQNSLFKLRYGVDFDEVRNLSIKRVVMLLQIQGSAMQNLVAHMKRIGDLNYNGEQP